MEVNPTSLPEVPKASRTMGNRHEPVVQNLIFFVEKTSNNIIAQASREQNMKTFGLKSYGLELYFWPPISIGRHREVHI